MGRPKKVDQDKKSAKDKLLEAAFTLIRSKGYAATTVDDLCALAEVSKGTFFHYFENKEAFAIQAAKHWSQVTSEVFKNAPYHKHKDPFDRFLGYIQFRKQILQGTVPEFTCLVGTMVQEAHASHPELRDACRDSIFDHAETLEEDIKEAKKLYKIKSNWSPESLPLHTQAVLQGAFILAKASNSADLAAQSVDHLINYIQLIFNKETKNV